MLNKKHLAGWLGGLVVGSVVNLGVGAVGVCGRVSPRGCREECTAHRVDREEQSTSSRENGNCRGPGLDLIILVRRQVK